MIGTDTNHQKHSPVRSGAWPGAKERKRFFFEKKNQKTSIRLFRALPGGGEADGENVFVSFFKKKRLLPLPPERSMMLMIGMIGVPNPSLALCFVA